VFVSLLSPLASEPEYESPVSVSSLSSLTLLTVEIPRRLQ